jgi:hypothetical protein
VEAKLKNIDKSQNRLFMRSDDDKRLVWRFDAPVSVPSGGLAEVLDACWCCAPDGQSCSPTTKSGLGRAILVSCFE